MRLFGTASSKGWRPPPDFSVRREVHPTARKWYRSSDRTPMTPLEVVYKGRIPSHEGEKRTLVVTQRLGSGIAHCATTSDPR